VCSSDLLNMGVTVRGMEFAIASGIMAAEAVIKAKEASDYSAQSLSYYEQRLKESFVLRDLYNYREMPGFLENDDFYSDYPKYFPDIVEKIMWFGRGPKEKLGKTLWKELKASGMMSLKKLKTVYGIKKI
jgi:electron transfer flavoprotein-quinone oxidoreductase